MADFPYNVEVDKKFNKSVTVKSLSTDLPNTKTVSYKDIAKALLAGDQQIIYSSGKQNNSLYKTYLTSDKSRYKNSSPSELKKLMSENFIIKLPINQFGVDSNFVSGFFLIPNNVIEEIKETIKSGQPNQADIEKEFNQLKDRTQKIGENFVSIVDDLDNFVNKDIKLPKSLKEITKSVNDARSELIKNNNRLNALKNLVEKDSDLYKKITELITENKNLIKTIDSAIKPLIKQAELKLNPPMDLSIIETIREKTKELGASLVKEYETIQNYLNKGETPKPSIEQIKKNIAKERKDLTKNIEQLNDLSRKLDSNAPEQKTIKKLIKDNEELINKFIDTSLKHFIEQAEKFYSTQKELTKIKTSLDNTKIALTAHLNNRSKNPINIGNISNQVNKNRKDINEINRELSSIKNSENQNIVNKVLEDCKSTINNIDSTIIPNIDKIKNLQSLDEKAFNKIKFNTPNITKQFKESVKILENFISSKTATMTIEEINRIKQSTEANSSTLKKNVNTLNGLKKTNNSIDNTSIDNLIKENQDDLKLNETISSLLKQAESKVKQNEEFTRQFTKLQTESESLRNKVTELNTNVNNHLNNPNKFPINTSEASKNATNYGNNLSNNNSQLEKLLASAPSEHNKEEIQKIIDQNKKSINTIADISKNISIIKKANNTDLTILTTISKSIDDMNTNISKYTANLSDFVNNNTPLPADFSLDKIKAEIKTEIPNKIKENNTKLSEVSDNLFEHHPDKAKVNNLISKNNDINNSINSTSRLSLLLQQAENKIKANKQNEEFTRQFTKLQTESDSLRNKVTELNTKVNNHLSDPNKYPIDTTEASKNATNYEKNLLNNNSQLEKLLASAPSEDNKKEINEIIDQNKKSINTTIAGLRGNISIIEKANNTDLSIIPTISKSIDDMNTNISKYTANLSDFVNKNTPLPADFSLDKIKAEIKTEIPNKIKENNTKLGEVSDNLFEHHPDKAKVNNLISKNNDINNSINSTSQLSLLLQQAEAKLSVNPDEKIIKQVKELQKQSDDTITSVNTINSNLVKHIKDKNFTIDPIEKVEVTIKTNKANLESNNKTLETLKSLASNEDTKNSIDILINSNNQAIEKINYKVLPLIDKINQKKDDDTTKSTSNDETIKKLIEDYKKESTDIAIKVNTLNEALKIVEENNGKNSSDVANSTMETVLNKHKNRLNQINNDLREKSTSSNAENAASIQALIANNEKVIDTIENSALPTTQRLIDHTTKPQTKVTNSESIKTLQNNSNTARTELDTIETMLNAHITDKKPLTKNIDEIESDVNRIKTTLENSNTDLINEKTTADKNNDTQTVSEINDTIKKNNKYLNLIDKYIDVCIDYLKPKTINTTNTVNRQKAVDVNTIDSNTGVKTKPVVVNPVTEVKTKPVVVNPVTEVKPEPTVTTITDTNTTASSVTDTNTAVKPVTDIKPTAKPVTEVKTESTVTPIDVKPYPLDVSYTTEVKTEPTVTPVTDTNTTVSSVTDINTTAKPVSDVKPTTTPVSDVEPTTTPLSDAKPTVTPVADTVTLVTEVKTEPTVTSTTNKSDDNATYDMIKENYDLFISNFKTLDDNLDKIKDSSIYSIGCLNSIIRDYNELNRSIKVHTQVLSEICSRTNSESDLYINSQSLIEKFNLLINNPDLINNAKIEDKKRELIELINNNNAKYASVKPANTNIIEENTTTVVNATYKPKNVSENSDSSINVSSTKKQVSESKTTSTQNENIANETSTRLVNNENTNCTENEYLKHINRINVKGNCSININNNGNSTRKTITLTPRGEVIITKGSENLNTRVQTTNHITESAADRMERRRKERQRRIAERRQRRIDNYETFGR